MLHKTTQRFSSSEHFLDPAEAQTGKVHLHSLEWLIFAHLTFLIQLLPWFSVPAQIRLFSATVTATDVENAAEHQHHVKLSPPHSHFLECLSLASICSRQKEWYRSHYFPSLKPQDSFWT